MHHNLEPVDWSAFFGSDIAQSVTMILLFAVALFMSWLAMTFAYVEIRERLRRRGRR